MVTPPPQPIRVYLETGSKRTFAGAIDWPGWCRARRDEESALSALLEYAPRYARALRGAGLEFRLPARLSEFVIEERLQGDGTTDFGAPGAIPSADTRPVEGAELLRLQTILKASWDAFESAAQQAAGRELSLGPRGGGRNLEKIVSHVVEAHAAYLGKIAWKFKPTQSASITGSISQARDATLEALAAEPRQGPDEGSQRKRSLWPRRYFVRRAAWHLLDHAWEIEDRIV